jgi:hypothetical protein
MRSSSRLKIAGSQYNRRWTRAGLTREDRSPLMSVSNESPDGAKTDTAEYPCWQAGANAQIADGGFLFASRQEDEREAS